MDEYARWLRASSVAAFIAVTVAACGGGGGGGISVTPPTSGGDTSVSCQDQFNPDLIATQDCTPVYHAFCPEEVGPTSIASYGTTASDVGNCDGKVTVSDGTATVDGISSKYVVVKPTNSSGGNALYVALHWAEATGPAMVNYMRLQELAVARNITIVAPTAPGTYPINRTWGASGTPSGPSGSAAPAAEASQLVALINEVIRQVKTGAVANAPILMAGSSGGAVMSFQYVCSNDKAYNVSGIELVAEEVSPALTAACTGLTSPVATVQVHGTNDPLGSYANSQSAFAFLYGNNGCNAADIKTATLPAVSGELVTGISIQSVYPCNASKGSSLVTVQGGGHNWPGEDRSFDIFPANIFGATSNAFDATLQGYDLLRYLGG